MENAGAIRGDLILDDSQWKTAILGSIRDAQQMHVALVGLRKTTLGLTEPLAGAGREMDAFAARSLRAAWSVNRAFSTMMGRNMTGAMAGIAAQMPVAGRAMDALAVGGMGAAAGARQRMLTGPTSVSTAAVAATGAATGIINLQSRAASGARATGALSLAVGGLGQSFRSLVFPMAAAGTGMTAFFGKAYKSAMAVQESENLFTESTGRMAASARAWSEAYADALGMNASNIRKGLGTLNVMLKSMGLTEDAALGMSKSMSSLAYDMASFYNISPEEAFQKLQAGISGETEPLKRLGILINENAVKQYALKAGLIQTGQQLSETGKIAARFGLIMQSTKTAQGDLARTMGSATNQQRAMSEQFGVLTRQIGEVLLPTVTRLFQGMNHGVSVTRRLMELNPEATTRFIKLGAGVTVAATALGTLGFVGPYVLGPLLGVGKALSAVGMLGMSAATGLAGIGMSATGIGAAATATTGLGASLGAATLGAGGIAAGLVGVVGAAYVARAVVKGFTRDFDALYVRAKEAESAVGGEEGGGFFGKVSRAWRKFDDWADKSGVAFTEFAGELLGGGGLDKAIAASNRVMLGSTTDARQLKEQQDKLTKDFLSGSVKDQIAEDFGINVDEMLGKLKGYLPDFDGMRKAIHEAMATATGPSGQTPMDESVDDILGRLSGLAEAAKSPAKSMADDFMGAKDGVDGLNDSLKETQGLLGSFRTGKAGTAGSGAPTPKAIADAIGMKGAKGTAAPRPWLPQMGMGMGEGMAQAALGQAPPVEDMAGIAGVPKASYAAGAVMPSGGTNPYASTYYGGYSGAGDWRGKVGITSDYADKMGVSRDYADKMGVSRDYADKMGVRSLRLGYSSPRASDLLSEARAGQVAVSPQTVQAKEGSTTDGWLSKLVDLMATVERNTRNNTASVGGY